MKIIIDRATWTRAEQAARREGCSQTVYMDSSGIGRHEPTDDYNPDIARECGSYWLARIEPDGRAELRAIAEVQAAGNC